MPSPVGSTQLLRFYIAVAVFSTAFGIMSPAVPLYARLSLYANDWELGILGAVMAVPYVIGSIFFGRVSDRVGRKPLLAGGLILYFFVVYAYMSTADILVFGMLRCLEGIAFSSIWPSAEAFVADRSRAGGLDRQVGYYSVAWSAGYTAGPFLMGAVISVWNLLSAFLLASVLILLGLATILTIRMPQNASSPEYDPQENRDLRSISGVVYIMVIWGFAMLTFYFLFPPYAVSAGVTASMAGYIVGSASGMRTASFLLYERFLKRNSAALGMGLLLLSTLLGWAFPSLFGFLAMAILFGSALGLLYAYALARMLELPSKGAGAGIFEAAIGFGQFFGPVTMGYIGFLLGSGATFLALSVVAAVSLPVALRISLKH
ncbi:MAG: MFS transporter [Candidatus Verstraetearchaeota archaeon]|nr:MFS transporter [Candidatus Verstraetearchaeota archaeon]